MRTDLVFLHAGRNEGRCGVPCARRHKEDPATRDIPVILVYDSGETEGPGIFRKRALRSPVDPAELVGAVCSLTPITSRANCRIGVSLRVQAVSDTGVVVRRVTQDPASCLIPGAALRLLEMGERSRIALEAFVKRRGAGA